MSDGDPISLVTRVVEGSPVIVLLLLAIGGVVWRTWRQERVEMLRELREEREARAIAHREVVNVAERSIVAAQAVERALTELREMVGVAQGSIAASKAVEQALIELRNAIREK